MSIQIIEKDGKPLFAVVPHEEYAALVAQVEDANDVREFQSAMDELNAGEETLPAEFVEKLLSSDSLIKTWREYRKMTQKDLADATGLSQPAIAMIESGQRETLVSTAAKIAEALGCDLSDLVRIESTK